ncbi:LemA family protein [Leptospira sp. GIMC2001]|uniref:LemA family protein n=1 Tax=Leptospira sp. GIMC2001 TaxID=1513297 RepID=UPI0023492ECD|nr:LemA family protein [Leptospira sp. GIMC2001]WCL50071.1 LemA family protein [Leptospira sp. GIMC2001]
MSILLIALGIPVLVIIILIFMGIGIYNGLIEYRNRFKNAFAQIDVQLKRRYDLIPNLVETAKSYMNHEKETLERVIKARNQAMGAEQQAAANPADPDAMKRFLGAEGALSGSMGGFFALMENYPDLKANQNMMQLSEELTTTENKISFARQAYNDSVMVYNTSREKFPNVIFAGMFGFHAAQGFEILDPTEREAIKVSFS